MYDKHLDSFLLIADCGSFTKATEKAYISPNAIIKQINLLEPDLGVTLFIRTNRGVKRTKTGMNVYQDTRHIVHLSNQAIQKAQQIEQINKHIICIGTSLLRPCKKIVDLYTSVSQNYPDIQLEIVPFDDTYQRWLILPDNLGKDIDIVTGIYLSSMWNCHCQVLKITDIPLCCAVSKKISYLQKTN